MSDLPKPKQNKIEQQQIPEFVFQNIWKTTLCVSPRLHSCDWNVIDLCQQAQSCMISVHEMEMLLSSVRLHVVSDLLASLIGKCKEIASFH